jgi:hypothetical protein
LTPTRSPGSIQEDMWILRRLMFSFTSWDLWSLNLCCWFVPFDLLLLLLLLLCCELLLNLILSSMVWSWTARVLQEFFLRLPLSLSLFVWTCFGVSFFLGGGWWVLVLLLYQKLSSLLVHCSNNSEAFLCIIRCVHEYEKWLQTLNMICFSPDIALYIQKENSESMYHASYYCTWFFLSRCTLHSTKKHCALALSSYIVCPFFSSWAVADSVMTLNTLSKRWYGYWTSASAIVQLILWILKCLLQSFGYT